jgi:hypothetical protein
MSSSKKAIKLDLLTKLDYYQKRGFTLSKKFNFRSTVNEMMTELEGFRKQEIADVQAGKPTDVLGNLKLLNSSIKESYGIDPLEDMIEGLCKISADKGTIVSKERMRVIMDNFFSDKANLEYLNNTL